ncbi:MAG: SIS domain-containing protein, partial [Erysipelotrichaceae bacterium]|nr:SIS domain-containing protein [Erysipelotrichaceae bacterium]
MNLTTMKDYIYAAPEVCNRNVSNAEQLVQKMIELYTKKAYKQITFVASGSSYTALQCARGYISKTLHVDVKIVFPYTFAEYDYQYVQEDHFVVVVTQSGASKNCISALDQLKSIGHETYCLTANVNSDCRDHADEMLDWGCGIETIGYVTLGVETLVTYLMLFAAYAAKALNISDPV